jgi:hypothetical protein
MQNCPTFFILAVFLLGCAVGFLLHSIYRISTLARFREVFADELQASVEGRWYGCSSTGGRDLRRSPGPARYSPPGREW